MRTVNAETILDDVEAAIDSLSAEDVVPFLRGYLTGTRLAIGAITEAEAQAAVDKAKAADPPRRAAAKKSAEK